MRQQLNFVTLGVRDLEASRRFYLEGLGWEATFEADEVCFIQVAPGLLLGLWGAGELAADVGADQSDAEHGTGRMSLASNVDSRAEVDAAVERVEAAGGTVLKDPQETFFGYHAYVADPDGFRWEIAHNPGWTVDDDGTVHIHAVDPAPDDADDG
jgi:catechol 2,3-dioxygenase-like lactoylglutathione lyase family enzyme